MLRKIFRNQHSGVRDLVFVFLLVALAPSLMAQTSGPGAFTGRVTDASGGVIANAQNRKVSLRLEIPPSH